MTTPHGERVPLEIRTEYPDPVAKAARVAYGKKRDRIIQEARAKGWRKWQGSFWAALEKKLRSIGCEWPEMFMADLRIDRAQEAFDAGIATWAELQWLQDLENPPKDKERITGGLHVRDRQGAEAR